MILSAMHYSSGNLRIFIEIISVNPIAKINKEHREIILKLSDESSASASVTSKALQTISTIPNQNNLL